MNWCLQDAKNGFSKLVRQAQADGPQTVTVRGEPAVVVLSVREYRELAAKRPSLAEYILNGPRIDDETYGYIDDRSSDPESSRDI
jgi:prevent-host-death family protein